MVGAGDIAMCGSPGVEATARLLDRFHGIVYTTGDNAYPSGSAEDFRNCYDPTWGRHRDRTFPSPGNHEYQTPGATGYFDYFGAAAGPYGLGYYSYTAGSWRIFSLNSEIGMEAGSVQYEWLRAELTANRARCTAAYWHRPLFTSGPNGPSSKVRDVFALLVQFGAEIVLTGHEHLYERFAPMTADGRIDPANGMRQFIVGTGGAELYRPGSPRPGSEVQASVFGVLALTLGDSAYRWEFVPVQGQTFTDSGAGQCH
jgi:hypothetical protein